MIHHATEGQLSRLYQTKDFFLPAYGALSIAELVPSVMKLFGIVPTRPVFALPAIFKRPVKKVVSLVIDGLGYDHFVKYHDQFPFFQKLANAGDVYPITSIFPSTTAAALTTLNTGLTAQEHGLPEWTVYFEEFDSIIETLPFKTWAMTERDGLVAHGGTAEMLYQGPTAYELLAEQGVKSFVFIYHEYADTLYSASIHRGAEKIRYIDGPDLMTKLRQRVASETEPTYYFVYWGNVDTVAHTFGPESPEHLKALQSITELLEHQFLDKLSADEADETTLLMVADHGHVNIKREAIINLNQYEFLEKAYSKGKDGQPIRPTGSPHDIFLFIKPAEQKAVIEQLNKELAGQAIAYSTEKAMSDGLFGLNEVSPIFRRRIGNVLILPYKNRHIWYEFANIAPFSFLGIHGGLSEEEMRVPLAIADLKALVAA